jgi:hypothetical protein
MRCHIPPHLSHVAVVFSDEHEFKKTIIRELRSVIRFLNVKNFRQAEIYRKFFEVYADGAVSEGSVRKWCRFFKEGRANLHDEEMSALLVTDDLKEKVNA